MQKKYTAMVRKSKLEYVAVWYVLSLMFQPGESSLRL
jgi:hypothetical protein